MFTNAAQAALFYLDIANSVLWQREIVKPAAEPDKIELINQWLSGAQNSIPFNEASFIINNLNRKFDIAEAQTLYKKLINSAIFLWNLTERGSNWRWEYPDKAVVRILKKSKLVDNKPFVHVTTEKITYPIDNSVDAILNELIEKGMLSPAIWKGLTYIEGIQIEKDNHKNIFGLPLELAPTGFFITSSIENIESVVKNYWR